MDWRGGGDEDACGDGGGGDVAGGAGRIGGECECEVAEEAEGVVAVPVAGFAWGEDREGAVETGVVAAHYAEGLVWAAEEVAAFVEEGTNPNIRSHEIRLPLRIYPTIPCIHRPWIIKRRHNLLDTTWPREQCVAPENR